MGILKRQRLKEVFTIKRNFLLASIAYIALVVLVLEIITAPAKTEQSTISPLSTKTIPTQFENEHLLEKIHTYTKLNSMPPIDAKIDPIWKLIPGYNGVDINIEESYLNMWPDEQFDEKRMVYEEISPQVHFSDLPPAPIYKGNPEKSMVTFLINVAWGNEYIPPILETLKMHHLKATFFFDGSWVNDNPDLAKKIYKDGHEIGNHAYSHPDLKSFSNEKAMQELKMTNDIIKETLNITPQWFAPPSGSFKDETVQIAHKLNMYTILWSVDTVDWKKPNTDQMVQNVVSKVHNGAMVLMHPTAPTAEGLEKMIVDIQKKGYTIGTVSDMMGETRILPAIELE